jgi:hypothetical protein
MEAAMNQILTYCTTRLFSRATLPMASLKIRAVEPGNDNDPSRPLPSAVN